MGVERMTGTESPCEGFPRQVERVLARADHRQRRQIGPTHVALHQIAERLGVAALARSTSAASDSAIPSTADNYT